MTKKRSDQQQLEDLSRARAKAVLSPFVVNDLENDFGLDLEVALTEEGEENQSVEPQNFYIQLKSSEDYGDSDTIPEDLSTDDLEFWKQQPIPVVLVAYSKATDDLYWSVIQNYIWDTLEQDNPSWARQETSRIRIPRERKLSNLDKLEEAVIRTQNRIIRNQSRSLNIGEGVEFTPEDFSEMDSQIESDLLSYKGHTLQKARNLFNQGKTEEARELVNEVYESPRDDVGTLKSIAVQIFSRDPYEPEVALDVLELAEQGVDLANELAEIGDEQYFKVHKHLANLYLLLRKQRQFLVTTQIHEQAEYELGVYQHLFSQEWRELSKAQLSEVSGLNDALSTLLDEGLYYEYAVVLHPILDYMSRQLRQIITMEVVDKEDVADAQKHRLVDQAETLLEFLSENETVFNLYKSLALYYYNSVQPDKAEENARKAIEIANELEDDRLVELSQDLLENIRENPDLYEHAEDNITSREQSELTTEEYQNVMKEVVEEQGFDLSDTENPDSKALQRGIEDADPSEYFRHCKHLRIKYWSSSPLGRITGVTSLGRKVMWCEHGGTEFGLNLEGMFEGFKSKFCEGCEHHSPRGDDWECTVGWVQEQEQKPEFQKVLDEIGDDFPF